MQRIKIDPEQLELKIKRLNALYTDCVTNSKATFDVVAGVGKTGDSMDTLNRYIVTLNQALASLIQSTIQLLNNAKDGYINADERTASLLQKLQGEVGTK